MKNQLSFMKEQKKNYKISEKNLIRQLNIKEKEVNDLRTILNTNMSIKSQITSLNHEWKDEDNSKEIKEIRSYNESINVNKKYYKPKSFSLIERRIRSFNNTINKRNILLINNNINKSYNSKNISKHKINNINVIKKKRDKIASNIISGSNTKRTKDVTCLKIMNNIIKPNKSNFYSNYNSVNLFRKKKLNKSDSRSHVTKNKGIKSKINLPDESINSKNILLNNNKSDIKSNKNIKENELKNKDKILINYNTNIINTNVSIDKLTIKQKLKDIRKIIDEKLNEITRNKRYNIKRTISAVYEKKDKSPFFNDKPKTKREPSLRYNNIYDNKNNSNKLGIKTSKKFQTNKYNSNDFIQKLQNFTIQNKNKNNRKNRKIKIKFKNNSMFNIKNDELKKNNDKILVIHGYTGKKKGAHFHLYKTNNKNAKIKKNNSMVNLNKMPSGKNQYFENKNKTIINNPHITGFTYRKSNNFDKIYLLNKKIKKNDINNKNIKNKNNEININNKMNSSLRKYIYNKCGSSSKIE